MFFSHWGAQHWAQNSRCGLISAEQRGRIPFTDLLALLWLMQHKVPSAFFAARAHSQLTLSLRTPRSFGDKVLPSFLLPRVVPSHMHRSSKATWHFPLLFMRFLSAPLSSLSRSLWMAAQQSGASLTSPSLVSSAIAEGAPAPSSRSLMKMLNRTGAQVLIPGLYCYLPSSN